MGCCCNVTIENYYVSTNLDFRFLKDTSRIVISIKFGVAQSQVVVELHVKVNEMQHFMF